MDCLDVGSYPASRGLRPSPRPRSRSGRARGGPREDRGRKGIFFQTLYEVAVPLCGSSASPFPTRNRLGDSAFRAERRVELFPVWTASSRSRWSGGTEAAADGAELAWPRCRRRRHWGGKKFLVRTNHPSFLPLSICQVAHQLFSPRREGGREGGRVG